MLIKLVITDEKAMLVGELTRYTVMSLPNKLIQRLFIQDCILFDLSAVTKADTAGLAWLIAIKEQAIKQGKQIIFSHVPEKLINLMKLSGVDGFLV